MGQLLLVMADGILPIAPKRAKTTIHIFFYVVSLYAHAYGRCVKIDSNHSSLQLAKASVYMLHRENKDR